MASESTQHNCFDVQGQQYLWLPMIIMVNRWKKLRSPSVKGFQLPDLNPLQSCLPKGLAAEEEAEEESAGIGQGRTQLLILKCEPGPTIRLRPLLPRHACFAVEKIPASWREWESELAGVQSTSQSETWWRWSQAFLALHNVYDFCSPSCLDGDEPLAGLLFLQRCAKTKTKTVLSSSLPFLWWSRMERTRFDSRRARRTRAEKDFNKDGAKTKGNQQDMVQPRFDPDRFPFCSGTFLQEIAETRYRNSLTTDRKGELRSSELNSSNKKTNVSFKKSLKSL